MIVPLPSRATATQKMPVPISAGSGRVRVDRVAGKSVVTTVWSRSPLRILTPCARGKTVAVCLSSLGGGLVAGDQVRLEVALGSGTQCALSTQASTKVYRNPAGNGCSQALAATLEEESLLAAVPDPIQAFAYSRYQQEQTFKLSASSNLILVDSFGSGRAACGERWAFDGYRSRNEVFRQGKRVLLDSLRLAPDDGPLADAMRLGRFNCYGLILVLGPLLREASEKLLAPAALPEVVRGSPLVISASPVAEGVLLRLAGESVEGVGQEIRRRLSFLPPLLGWDPWARKW